MQLKTMDASKMLNVMLALSTDKYPGLKLEIAAGDQKSGDAHMIIKGSMSDDTWIFSFDMDDDSIRLSETPLSLDIASSIYDQLGLTPQF